MNAVALPVKTTKHVVQYTLAYDHVVCVGIEAESPEEAIEKAQALFSEGTLWNDTPEVRLLTDDYVEQEHNVLNWEVLESGKDSYPPVDSSVTDLKERAALTKVARSFIEAYEAGQRNGGSCDQGRLDAIFRDAVAAGLTKEAFR